MRNTFYNRIYHVIPYRAISISPTSQADRVVITFHFSILFHFILLSGLTAVLLYLTSPTHPITNPPFKSYAVNVILQIMVSFSWVFQ